MNRAISDSFFRPRSVALVGITLANPQHWTRDFIDAFIEFRYDGRLYLVNPRGGELKGLKVYQRLEDIPDSIDYVISLVPAKVAPELIRACAGKGVKIVHYCTSGFAEIGSEEGIRLEAELLKMAQKVGTRFIGPNCMGLYCPESRISYRPDFPKESGSIAFISQSGGNATYTILKTKLRGVRFSKVVSYGNATDLNESDYLEYIADDPATDTVALYVEGVRDGARFRKVLEDAARKKMVILLKGGVTDGGTRAVAGHTGALAGSEATWDALCRQFGVIRVYSLDELCDILLTRQFMPHPVGRRAAAISYGGGASVLLTDEFEKSGMKFPPLPPEVRQQILGFSLAAGNIIGNPMDYSQNAIELDKLFKTTSLISKWGGVDLLIGYLNPVQVSPGPRRQIVQIVETMHAGARAGSKQLVMVIESGIISEQPYDFARLLERCAALGIPVYFSSSGAARAISTVLSYNPEDNRA